MKVPKTDEKHEFRVKTDISAESSLKISSFGEDELGEVYVVDRGGAIYRLMERSEAQ